MMTSFLFRGGGGGLSRDDGRCRRGEGGKNGDFWMTSYLLSLMYLFIISRLL